MKIPARFSTGGEVIVPALSILFGLQLLRVAIPQMVWLFGDRFGMNAAILGIIALAVFAFSYLSGVSVKLFGRRKMVLISGATLSLSRLIVQFQWTEPLIPMLISLAGVIAFGLFLAAYTDEVRSGGKNHIGTLIAGILSGLILDTALHGAFATLDYVWQSGWIPIVLTAVLVLSNLSVIFTRPLQQESPDSGGMTWPWLAIGPFLFLQMVVFQNIARHTVTTGWIQPYVFGWVMICQIAGLFAAVLLLKNTLRNRLPISLIAGFVLVAAASFPYPGNDWLAAIILAAEHISVSVLFALILTNTVSVKSHSSTGSVTIANGTGFLLLGLLTLAYYTVYQITLPYTNTVLEPAAAGIIALCGIIPWFRTSNDVSPVKVSWLSPVLSLVLLLLPLTGIIVRDEPYTATGSGYPVTVMTYNLHNGFNPKGDLDLEAMARVIEEANPDIVILQEISRGWLISGRTDMLDWLSLRLGMPAVSGPTEGALWGSAILSRFPVIESTNYELPPRTLFLRRGYLITKYDIGNNESLTVIATHLHHVPGDSEIRQQQVPVLLDTWNNAEYTVITGDLNAQPDSPEMGMMSTAGLTDVMADSVPPEGYTFNSVEPFERIDYLWITPDLTVVSAGVLNTQASDHMPIIAVLSRE